MAKATKRPNPVANELHFTETDTRTLYKMLKAKINEAGSVQCVIYSASPIGHTPTDMYMVRADSVDYGRFFGLFGKELTINGIMNDGDVTVVISDPAYLIENGVNYYVDTRVFGGKHLKVLLK